MNKALVVYDSAYGNTAIIAEVVTKELSQRYDTKMVHVNDADSLKVSDANLLVIGSPTQGGRPTKAIESFIEGLSETDIKGKEVAVFDSRFAEGEHGVGLKLLMRTIDFAADKMQSKLVEKGGRVILEPKGFIVAEKKGPLSHGELRRAADWIGSASQVL